MRFEWTQFLQRHAITYTTDAGERNATCGCPFCGQVDVEHHYMAISLKGRGWRCWRNQNHRGKFPARLVQAFLRCSYEEAKAIVGEVKPVLVPDRKLASSVSKMLGVKAASPVARDLVLPKEFLKLTRASKAPWGYLRERGYSDADIHWLVKNYNLRFARRGLFRYRIIVPITDAVGDVVCWTGRTWIKDKTPRYLSLTTDVDLAASKGYKPAVLSPPELILGLDLLWSCDNPDILVLCEGPFDALRVSCLGNRDGVWGTCLFGLNISKAQVDLLCELATRFRKCYLLLDTDARMRSFAIRQALLSAGFLDARLPRGVKDPGDLTRAQYEEVYDTLS